MALRVFPATIAIAALLAAGACSDRAAREPEAAIPPAAIALSDEFGSDFALIDQAGRPVVDEDLKGKVSLIYFGFATCPDVCPMALGRMSAALDLLSEAERAKVRAAFVTVDPDRDTPEKLAALLAFDPRITGLTGDRAAVEAAKASFKVFAEPEPSDDPAIGYVMNHTSLIYLVDSDLKPMFAIQDAATPDDLAALVRRYLPNP